MLSKIIATAVVIACAPFAASAEALKTWNVGGTTDIDIIVLCSEFPQITAETVSDFLTSRSAALPPLSIVDGATFPDTERLKAPQLTKVLFFAANAAPSQQVKDCLQRSVPFAQEVLDFSSEAWSGIGLRRDDPAHPSYIEGIKVPPFMGPTSTSVSVRFVRDEGWTFAVGAGDGSESDTGFNLMVDSLISFDP